MVDTNVTVLYVGSQCCFKSVLRSRAFFRTVKCRQLEQSLQPKALHNVFKLLPNTDEYKQWLSYISPARRLTPEVTTSYSWNVIVFDD